ncbi:MAG: tRNA lysidine(34) synthetase TilS [Bacteroidota bacterium]
MTERFLAFINKNELFDSIDTILLAVSGGVDSMVMIDLFAKSKLKFTLAHCNFQLRGDESDKDEKFIIQAAEQHGTIAHTIRFDTKKYATEQKLSTQMAARNLRYQWFNEIINQHGYDRLATAHHLDDVIETMLFNLAKGTGIAGFHGIEPKRDNIVRPMLFCDKGEILAYAQENALSWREDQSNQSLDYQRNLIRHKVVPVLREINPDLSEGIKRTTRRIKETEQLFSLKLDSLREEVMEKRGVDYFLNKDLLIQQKERMIILFELLKPFGFGFVQSEALAEQLPSIEVGKVFESNTHRLNVDRDHLIVSPIVSQEQEVADINSQDEVITYQGMQLKCEHFDQPVAIIPDKSIAFLDRDKLTFPLKMRKWQEGDRFVPLGMRHKKKLSDFMIDNKIPLNLKERVFVVLSENEIVWVVGHRIDDRFKVTDETQYVFRISLKDS